MDATKPTEEQLKRIVDALNTLAKTRAQLRMAVANLDCVMNDVREQCGAPIGHIYDTADDKWIRARGPVQQEREPEAGRVILPRQPEQNKTI